jgi:UDP-GlcNAc:undecaprenyl-phosphate/decaprenyl-phosphate GlcNAc-1-phosphate transferase
MEYFIFLMFGLLLGFLGIYGAQKFFPRFGLLDFPSAYGLSRKPLPYPGGLVFWIFSLGLILYQPQLTIWLPVLILGAMSFWDDRKNLSALNRLLIHFTLAFYTFFALGIQIDIIGHPFESTNVFLGESHPFWALGLTIFWIVAIQNALNWFDGLPGLSVGIAGLGFLTLGILGLVRPELLFDPAHQYLTHSTLFLGAMCLGGFWFFWKQKIILGDTGSQVLGFLLATLSIMAGAKIATTLLVLLIPLLDFFFVIGRRIFIDRKKPWQGDLEHLHHNMTRHFSAEKVVLILLGFSLLFAVMGLWFLDPVKNILLLLAILIFLGVEIYFFPKKKIKH